MSEALARAASATTLLNLALREADCARVVDGAALIPLANGAQIVAPLRHRSAVGHHRYAGEVLLVDGEARPVAPEALAPLLLRALGDQDPTDLLARIDGSVRATAETLARRAGELDVLWSPAPQSFLTSEQALLCGHPLHPTPKGLPEMSAEERRRYAPEETGGFRLAWIAAERALVAHDSAADAPAPELLARLLGEQAGDRVLLPLHPWEAAHLRSDPAYAALLADGGVVELGERGAPVAATSSVRTVYRADWPWQLKLSLHVRVTNSKRVSLPKELRRAVEAARLARTEVGAAAARIAPQLVVVQDPAFAELHGRDGAPIAGAAVLLRANRWRGAPGEDVSSLAALAQERPDGGPSRLAQIVRALAAQRHEPVAAVAREWFARYLAVVVSPLLRLYLDLGLTYEPHAQNTLLELEGGWPARGVIRDSQGYFHREAAHEDLCATIPALGEASESIFEEALCAERLVYYPFANAAFAVVDALGAAGCADELLLLADLRGIVERERAAGGRYAPTLLDRLLDDERWPCKANLRTRLHELDELVGDIAEQSVYVTIANPLRAAVGAEVRP
jgi:siderophore synthetase component